MGAPDILAQLHTVGVNLSRKGDKLIATPKASVTPDVVELLRAHKPELLEALETPPVHPPLSNATQAELRRLVPLFTAHCGFGNEDAEEALQVALEHPDNALMFYRGKVRLLGLQKQ